MPRRPDPKSSKKPIEQYEHKGKKRTNNPPAGLVDSRTDAADSKKTYVYDPHIDPSLQFDQQSVRRTVSETLSRVRATSSAVRTAVIRFEKAEREEAKKDKPNRARLEDLQTELAEASKAAADAAAILEKVQNPYLAWAGKAERSSFELPTVSLHVHERIDPRAIIEAVRKKNGSNYEQLSLFGAVAENPPLREAIEFYRHAHNWSNRLIAGDSLLVMNSLVEKEGLSGQVQMVYFDPPYGIKYGSNFQPFVNKRDVKEGKDEDLTAEPEMVKAFRDTWELGIHSYLSYLRDRLMLARDLLHESGSIFVQIGDENLHLVRNILDEVFGAKNFVSVVTFKKTAGQTAQLLPGTCDYVLWYGRDTDKIKFRTLFKERRLGDEGADAYMAVELPDGTRRRLTDEELAAPENLPKGAKPYRLQLLTSQREGRPSGPGSAMYFPVAFNGREFFPEGNRGWTTTAAGMKRLLERGRIAQQGNSLAYIRYLDDFPAIPLTNFWNDTQSGSGMEKIYVVQTNVKVVTRCMLMATDPGDIALDITCGSGTTAVVAEQWGRRWISCDTSRVALTLAKQRLMTAVFDYYQLARSDEGVDSGFTYKTVPHVTLASIANNELPEREPLFDQPLVDSSRARVTGPFTVEAVPAPMVQSPAELSGEDAPVPTRADDSVGRSGATWRQEEWRAELLRTGVRGKGGQKIYFSRIEPLPGTRWLHADAETKEEEPQRAVVSFGPEHAPLDQRQVEQALEEARKLFPRPKLVLFASFQFDPEAAKDIDELNWPGVTTLKAQMNADLLTEDLKKKRTSNDSFWLIGQPDVALRQIKRGDNQGMWEVEVHGFDYYNTKTGQIDSGGAAQIAVWMLDTDYDGRSLFPRQVFFPLADDKGGWAKLGKNLKAEIDEDAIEAYRGTVSLPFQLGKHKRVGIKIVDDRGIESLKVVPVE